VTDKISAYSTAEPIAPIKGSNGNGVVADKPQGDARRREPRVPSRRYGHPDEFRPFPAKDRRGPCQGTVVNAGKVAAIKQAINSGTYQIDAGASPTSFCSSSATLKQLMEQDARRRLEDRTGSREIEVARSLAATWRPSAPP